MRLVYDGEWKSRAEASAEARSLVLGELATVCLLVLASRASESLLVEEIEKCFPRHSSPDPGSIRKALDRLVADGGRKLVNKTTRNRRAYYQLGSGYQLETSLEGLKSQRVRFPVGRKSNSGEKLYDVVEVSELLPPDYEQPVAANRVTNPPPERFEICNGWLIGELPKTPSHPERSSRFLFTSREEDITGREAELKVLWDFLEANDPFRWWLMTGVGGVGKSALALHLCREAHNYGWQAGFVVSGTKALLPVPNADRTPLKHPTLLIVDSVTSLFQDGKAIWPEILREVSNWKHPADARLRILFIDRPREISFWDDFFKAAYLEAAEHSYNHREQYQGGWRQGDREVEQFDRLELKGLSDETLLAVLQTSAGKHQDHLQHNNTREILPELQPIDAKSFAAYRKIDPIGRPLFAWLAGEAWAETGRFGSLGDIASRVVNNFLEEWRKADVDDQHLNLLLLATLIREVTLDTETSKQIAEIWRGFGEDVPELADVLPIKRGQWTCTLPQVRRLAALSHDVDRHQARIEGFLPDPIGEFFALQGFLEPWVGSTVTPATHDHHVQYLLQLTYAINPDLLEEFSRRVVDDYRKRHANFWQALRHLPVLDLSHAEIEYLTPLKRLKALQKLNLLETQVQDLTPLKGLEALTELNLWYTDVHNVTPLTGLNALTKLNLGLTDVQDLTPLTGLTALTTLHLTSLGVQDLTPLKGLKALTTLYLSNNAAQDLTPLKGLNALTRLNISGRYVQDLNPLKGLNALSRLDISGNPVQDLAPLKALTALTILELSATKVHDLTPLKGLNALTILDLSGTDVHDLTPLKGLNALTTLDLSGTKVHDLTPLKGLNALTELNLRHTQVHDLTPLQDLKDLTELNLSSNLQWSEQVEDLNICLFICNISFDDNWLLVDKLFDGGI